MRVLTYFLCLVVFTIGCSGQNEVETENVPVDVTPSLGIRPNGDTEIMPDLTQVSDELQEVFGGQNEFKETQKVNYSIWEDPKLDPGGR